MSADSSGLGKPDGGSSPGEMSSSTPEAGEVTEGKVDNACNSQAHSTPHCTQSQTNHTPIPIHTQNADGTNQDGASCHGDKGAKVGEQNDGLTSMTVKVSNSEQKCMGKSSYKKVVGTQCASNEDSESSVEDEDQSDKVESLGGKGGKQDKTFGNTRSENDAGDPSNEAVQEAEKVNLDENPRGKSDSNRIPKGNEQKDNCNGAIPGVKDEKHNQKSGRNDTEERKSVYENAIDNMAVQEAENENHDQNSELKHTGKRPSGNEYDIYEGAMQRAEDEKHDQNNGNKDIDKRSSGKDIDDGAMQGIEVERTRGNEKDTDNRTRPSVKNENNGDNDIEKRLIKYEKNDKGNMKTKVVKEESPDIKKKANDTERESRENEKKDHPDNATQSASIKKRQRIEKSLEDNGSEQSQNEMSGNTNNDGEWSEGKKERDKRRPTCLSGDPDMNPSNVNTDGTDSTISEQDDNGAMPGAVMLPIDNSKDKSVMKNEGLGQIAVTATDRESQTEFGKLKNELGETDKGTIENKGNYQDDGTNLISQAGNSELSDNTASVLGYPSKNFDDSDGGTKEIKGKGALGKTTPNTQTDSQDENHAYHQDEAGAISSEPSREALSFSQRLDDDTLLEKQLDEFIDNISTGINENREEWKKSTKKKMKSFLRTKVMDGTLSQRSFDSCVTNNIPVENFDSDIHITEKPKEDGKGAMRGQGAEGGPFSSQYDPSKCTTAPDAEIPFIDSEENGQGPPEQSTSQTEVTKSLHEKTSRAPNPTAGDPRFSKTCSSTESSRQAEKRDKTAMHLNRSLNAASSNKFPSDSRGYTAVDEAKYEYNLRGPSGQTTLPDSSETMDSKLLHDESNKKSSNKPRPTDMLEMIKWTIVDKQDTFNNKLSQETVSTSQDRTNREKKPERVSREKKSARNVGIIVQIGSEKSKEFNLPCKASDYFKWWYCLLDDSCLATLQESFHSKGCYLQLLENKQPVFMFPSIRKDIVEPLQYAFQKTVAQHDIRYHFFDLDLDRPEKDVIRFCKRWNNANTSARALLFLDKSYGKVTFYLVGKRTDVDLLKPTLESMLNKFYDKHFADDAELHTWKKNLDSACIKILEKMKKSFENMFQVKISLLGTSETKITATTEDNVDRVLRRVQEMSESIQTLKLPYEHYMFLMRSEKARVYVEKELRRNGLKIHFLIQEIKDSDILKIFEENNMKLEEIFPKVQDLIFYIPATDVLCHIFMSDKGKEIFADLVKENDGKVQMILDTNEQPCCLGTKDIEEKFKNTVANYVLTTKEYVKLPSEEVWRFCKQHQIFRDIVKEACCEVQYVENAELPWTVEISGPSALVSDCCENIKTKISKIITKTITSIDFSNESAVTSLILKMNNEKRCFINIRSDRSKSPAPWKKWMEKKGMEVNRIYSVNLNSLSEIQDDEIKLVLIPEEQKGAISKRPFDRIPGTLDQFQMFVPGTRIAKFNDFVTERFKEVLKYNQDNLQKRCLIVDCDRVPKECLIKSMKVICHTIDTTMEPVCISKCEFCDTRLEMFDCMIKVIDTHLNNKNYEFLEWKGRSIEMDVRSGQLALQKGFDVLVNSASFSLNLNAGVISASLLKAAGSGIQNEINKHKGKVHPLDIVVTQGYYLDCKNVFHGFIPKNVSSEKIQCLRTMVRKCLEKADEMGMESIAFPALGTGNLGYNRRDVANALFEEVEKYESEVKIGSLNRVCCVIYEGDIDANKDFQSRLLKWKQDHKVEREVIVTSDTPDVIGEICREVLRAMRQTVTIWEPQKAEITEDMRKGNISIVEDTEGNHTRKKKGSSQRGDYSSEERLCLLLKAKEDNGKDIDNSWRKSIREDFKDIAENIVCPFQSPNQALLQFFSENDVEDVFKSDKFKEKYEVQKLPPQAVNCLEAVLSFKMTQLLIKKHISSDEIRRNSGVSVRKNATDPIVLCGNMLEIKAAYAYFSSIVKEASLSETEQNDIVRDKAHECRKNNLPNDEIPEHAPKITAVSGEIKAPQSRTIPRSDHRASEENPMQVPIKEIKSDVFKVDYLTCKEEDVMLLNHFFNSLMKNVEEIRGKGQSIILRFHDQHSKKNIEESLQKIKKLPRVKFPVPSIDRIDTLLLKKCTEDTLCFISEDHQQVEIIGRNEGILNNIKEELETRNMPDLESKKVDRHFESPEMPVFVTDEGISVYVKCSSLLNLQTPVDAIVCPISNQESLYHGLPKVISEFAGQEYVRKLREILKKNENAYLFVAVIPVENIQFCSYVVNVSTNRTQLSKQENESMEYEQFLLQLMLQIFCKAEEKGIRSIAIPAICSGKRGFTKELCAQCYGISVVKYSRTIQDETKGLTEIHFVDKSQEMLSYIESVFTQPECLDRFEVKAMEMARSASDDHSMYPYYTEGGNFHLNEKLSLTVLASEVSKQNSSEGILVYYENFDKTEKKKVFAKWLPHAEIKQLKPCKGVMFLKHNSIMSSLEHAILPVWREEIDLNKFGADLSDFYRLIFLEANKLNPLKLVMPLYGSLKGNEIVTRISAESLFKVLCEVGESFSARSAKLSILLANEDKQTCSIIMDEIRLLIYYDQAGLLSSTSKTPINRRHGNQPRGHIVLKKNKNPLKGYKCGTIEIYVRIPDGKQQNYHPHPRKRFIGRKETIFLPDDDIGNSIACLLVKAFNQKILYCIKTSNVQNIDMVMETDIPIFNKRENYPNFTQLQKLKDLLQSKVGSCM